MDRQMVRMTDDEDKPLSGDSDEDESTDEEALDSDRRHAVELQLSSSIYDDAFLAPLVGHHGRRSDRHAPFRFANLSLGATLALQFAMLYKIGGPGGLTSKAYSDYEGLLWEPGESNVDGLCQWETMSVSQTDSAEQHLFGEPPATPEHKYLNCQASDVYFLRNFDYLDRNGDGYWSPEEAKMEEERWKQQMRSRVEATTIQRNMHDFLKNYAVDVYREDITSSENLQARTVLQLLKQANGSIPRDVFTTQVEPFHKMCLVMVPELCGNIVFRRSLNRSAFLEPLRRMGFTSEPLAFTAYDKLDGGSLQSMARVCEVATRHICPALLSADYRVVRDTRNDACGMARKQTRRVRGHGGEANERVILVSYEGSHKRTMVVLSRLYTTFLALILLLWGISMLEEANTLLLWWRVLLGFFFMPRHDRPARVLVNRSDTIEVHALQRRYCLRVILTNLMPRSLICLGTTWFGTQYLLAAESYPDLIMNSLAMTFLITIDDLVFAAVVPSIRKGWVEKCQPISSPAHWAVDKVIRCVLHELCLFVILISAVGASLYMAYWQPRDGFNTKAVVYKCLCQAAGQECLNAWLLGGYPDVIGMRGYSA